jgi:hypothetical protein
VLIEPSFDTGIVILNYAEAPDAGAPLVLLHGGSARWQAWEPMIDALATDHHLTITLRPKRRNHIWPSNTNV